MRSGVRGHGFAALKKKVKKIAKKAVPGVDKAGAGW